MATVVTNTTSNYAQVEQSYEYCSVCGRKSYQLTTTGGPVATCGAFNSAPATYPQAICQGTMTKSSNPTRYVQVCDERSSS